MKLRPMRRLALKTMLEGFMSALCVDEGHVGWGCAVALVVDDDHDEEMRGKKIEGIIKFSSMSKIVSQKIILRVCVDSKEDGCE